MTLGNHGGGGGIYHIKKETVSQHIFSLIKKRGLDKIRITEVNFFSHNEIENKDKNTKKDKKIFSMHE